MDRKGFEVLVFDIYVFFIIYTSLTNKVYLWQIYLENKMNIEINYQF